MTVTQYECPRPLVNRYTETRPDAQLFGGRGQVKGGLLGAALIATIANGIDLLGYSSAARFIVTGIILLGAVTLDTVSRRRLAMQFSILRQRR